MVKLQQKVTKREKLSATEDKLYNDYMQRITEAAQNLTRLEEHRADSGKHLPPWSTSFNQIVGLSEFNDHIKGIKSKIEAFGGFKGASDTKSDTGTVSDSITTKKPKDHAAKATAKPVIDRTDTDAIVVNADKHRDPDSVAVNTPPPDASIAEAKPVALSIAGVGGVASAKPVATAVVGPGGLAVSRPGTSFSHIF